MEENKGLLKEIDVELKPFEFEGYSNYKDTNVKFFKDYLEVVFTFDYSQESEQEDDLFGKKVVKLSSSTYDVVCLDKKAIVELSYLKEMLTDPEDEEKQYPIWSVVISNLSGNIKIRCKNKATAVELKNTLIDWKYNIGEFNEQQ